MQKKLTKTEIDRILCLLATQDISMAAIARRMGCAKSSIALINEAHGIRSYSSPWTFTVCTPKT